MIHVPLLDELREIRRRLSEQCDGDMERYVRMLRESVCVPNAPFSDRTPFSRIPEASGKGQRLDR